MESSALQNKGITGFIDILGFGNKVLEISEVSDLEHIISAVNITRKKFGHNPKDPSDKKIQKFGKITTLAFSDCVIFNMPLKSSLTIGEEFGAIMAQVEQFAYSQFDCILNDFFIRGAIDLGWWYYNKEEEILVSESLTRAAKAEPKACYPILVITSDFHEYFSTHKDQKYYSDNLFSYLFEEVTTPKNEKFLYLDYLKIVLEGETGITKEIRLKLKQTTVASEKDEIMRLARQNYIEKWLKIHAEKIKNAHALSMEQSVKDKYIWLSIYHNKKVQEFNCDDSCICKIES